MAFTHLHMHTEYSLLDGASRIEPLVRRLKELGFTHAAITDHGVMYGVIDFYNACKKHGITPIIGCEVYICENRLSKDTFSREYSHLILLCENNTGYRNLMKLVSLGFTEGYYYRPRIDYGLLEQYHEGLICLSACLYGDIPKALMENRRDDATLLTRHLRDLFGKDRFYIEIQNHGLPEQRALAPRLINLARVNDVPIVCTNDCHYLYKEDASAQEVLMCIQTGKTLMDEDRMRMNTREMYVKSEAEMRSLFPEVPDAFDNTQKIAEMCHVDFEFGKLHLPAYPVPNGETPIAMLTRLCEKGLQENYPKEAENPDSEPAKRLRYELSVIEQMGYVDYFLIVWDFIHYAKKHGIMVGPGRGSGAGSIVAYTLHITLLDPLKYSLLFERFLNPERMSMPDLDIDFCYERRQEVIDYVAEKYGHDRVCQIITFGTMKAKAVIRDVARVMGLPYALADKVAKAIPFALDMTLDKALSENPELKNWVDTDADIRKLYDMALRLEGLPRHASTHAAGVLITASPLTEFVPLQMNDNVLTTQYPMGTLERLGLLKMDFLGLRTLTVIRDTLAMMEKKGVSMTMEAIPLDDPAVYAMMARGDTTGVFQLESGGIRQCLEALKPTCFEDIIAVISLYRPGPMDSIPRYIAGKRNPESVQYKTPMLKPILENTYGCMVYQEQVMQIVRDLAGYSLGRSDLMRRAMAKKKKDVMAQEKEYFIHGMCDENGNILIDGALRRGVSEEAAESIYAEMSAFASYAFNKSHAAAYAMVAVQTAWLKYYHPREFLAALINSVMDNAEKAAGYIQYCKGNHLPILPPRVNESAWSFAPEGEGIRFGLGVVRNVGRPMVDTLCKLRENGPFLDFYDFCERMPNEVLNKRALECLIKAGAFDGLNENRQTLLQGYETLLNDAQRRRRDNVAGQLSLFDLAGGFASRPEIAQLREQPLEGLLALEREVTGVYISGHPLDNVRDLLSNGFTTAAELLSMAEEENGQEHDGIRVRMGGIFTYAELRSTKKGDRMANAVLEDLTGAVQVMIFPKVFERCAYLVRPDQKVIVEGRLSLREEEDMKILCDNLKELSRDNVEKMLRADEKRLLTGKVPQRGAAAAPSGRASQEAMTNALHRTKDRAEQAESSADGKEAPPVSAVKASENMRAESTAAGRSTEELRQGAPAGYAERETASAVKKDAHSASAVKALESMHPESTAIGKSAESLQQNAPAGSAEQVTASAVKKGAHSASAVKASESMQSESTAIGKSAEELRQGAPAGYAEREMASTVKKDAHSVSTVKALESMQSESTATGKSAESLRQNAPAGSAEQGAASAAKKDSHSASAVKASEATRPTEATDRSKLSDARLAKLSPKKICVYLPNRIDLALLREICISCPGDIPVYVKPRNEGITLLLEKACWVNGSKAFWNQASTLSGVEIKLFEEEKT